MPDDRFHRRSTQDDPHLGIRELKAVTDGAPRSMLVGITCGISAAYVLGQVEHGMATDRYAMAATARVLWRRPEPDACAGSGHQHGHCFNGLQPTRPRTQHAG